MAREVFLYPVSYYLSQDAVANKVDPLTPNTDGLYATRIRHRGFCWGR